jgi:hypothetical protein
MPISGASEFALSISDSPPHPCQLLHLLLHLRVPLTTNLLLNYPFPLLHALLVLNLLHEFSVLAEAHRVDQRLEIICLHSCKLLHLLHNHHEEPETILYLVVTVRGFHIPEAPLVAIELLYE